MRVALLFIDGVGVGPRAAPSINPLAGKGLLLSQFSDAQGEPLPTGGQVRHLDATFGIPGRPQSATNQTALFTGQPAPRLLGRHVLGFPTPPLRTLLAEHSLVRAVVEAGLDATFANVYPAEYLDAIGVPKRTGTSGQLVPEEPRTPIPARYLRRARASASTLAMAAGAIPLRTLGEARHGTGLTHDIHGRRARARGFPVPERTPREAAQIFWELAEGHAFTLFEHYAADEAGHAQDAEAAAEALDTFDAFARAAIELRPPDVQLFICSDHGNVEDLSSRGHTLNLVPLLAFGPATAHLDERPLENLADLGAFLRELAVGAGTARAESPPPGAPGAPASKAGDGR